MRKNILKQLRNQLGVAMDEAVLVAAMVASLGALVATNVPWGTLFNESSQIIEDISLIETANSEFYQRHRLWPHQTTNGDWKMNVAALATPGAMRYPYSSMRSFKNLVPSFSAVGTKGETTALRHNFGDGGNISQRPVSFKGQEYIEIIFESIPLADARRLDMNVDGVYDPDNGRVYLIFNEDQETVNLHYRGNMI